MTGDTVNRLAEALARRGKIQSPRVAALVLLPVVRELVAEALEAAAEDLDGQWMPAPQWDFPRALRDRAAALRGAR